MTRWLRTTMYDDDLEAMTTVGAEDGLDRPIEEAAEYMRGFEAAFVVAAVEELDEDDLREATPQLLEMIDTERECNMAILYWWTLAQFARLTADGAVGAPDPAPLTVREITDTLKQLARHPAYTRQRVAIPSEDREHIVILADGNVTTEGL